MGERRFFFKDENRGSSAVPSTAVRGPYLVHPDRGSVVHLLIPPGLLVSQEFGLDWGPLPVHIAREPLHVSDDVVLPELLQLPDAPAPRDGRRDERDEKRGSRPTPPRDAAVRPPIATVHRGHLLPVSVPPRRHLRVPAGLGSGRSSQQRTGCGEWGRRAGSKSARDAKSGRRLLDDTRDPLELARAGGSDGGSSRFEPRGRTGTCRVRGRVRTRRSRGWGRDGAARPG